jgi:hypothetical protein
MLPIALWSKLTRNESLWLLMSTFLWYQFISNQSFLLIHGFCIVRQGCSREHDYDLFFLNYRCSFGKKDDPWDKPEGRATSSQSLNKL